MGTFFSLVIFPDGVEWDGIGWDQTGYQKCPSIFCILCGYIDHIVKSCPHKFLVGLKFCSSWGSGFKNSKTQFRQDFLKIIIKVDHQISPNLRGPFTKNSLFFIFLGLFIFKGISLIKLKWILFFMSFIGKGISYVFFVNFF